VRMWRGVCSFASRQWDNFFAIDPGAKENFAYLLYYWRARLRWPIRLVGVLLLLLLAFRYPWHAYAVTALGCAAAAVYIAPHLNLHPLLTRPVMGGLATMVCALCWLLPYTTAYLLGIGLWGLVLYASWQICLGASLLLLVFCYLPTLALCLVAAAAWLLFLLVLPRICLLLTELSVGCYFLSWYWPFVHVVLLCLLASGGDIKTLIPLAILCVVLFYFPRIVLSMIGLFGLWMLWPLFSATRTALFKLLDAPYGTGAATIGEMPEKVKNGEEAAEVALAGKSHYEILHAYRGASPVELKACYKRMALLLHPDKNSHESAATAFKKVGDAFAVLSDPLQRAEYDASVDNGEALESEDGALADGEVRPPDDMPSGPPGLKKRKARPVGARGRR